MSAVSHFCVVHAPAPAVPWTIDDVRSRLVGLCLRPSGSWHFAAGGSVVLGWLGSAQAAPLLIHAGDLAAPVATEAVPSLAAGQVDCPLDGTFAACAFDPQARQACLYTDIFGMFPLYRYERAGVHVFATSLRLLTALVKPTCHLDQAAVHEMIGFHLVLGNRTLLREIELVAPATMMRLGDGAAQASTYWDWRRLQSDTAAAADVVRDTYARIEKAVLRSVRHARRIAVSLSGGLDSRLLCAILARNGVSFQCYNIDFGNETAIARRVAQTLHAPLKIMPMLPEPARTMFQAHDAMDCAYNVNQTWGWDMAEQAARDGCDVILDGLAFDTILGTVHRVQGDSARPLAEGLKANYQEIDVHTLGRVTGVDAARAIQESLDRSMLAEADACLRAAGPRASEYFTMVNRIRRYTFGYSLANLYHLRGAFPYVTRALFEHCMRLPLELRLEHRLYRRIYCELFPELAAIPWAKTMLPLDQYGAPASTSRWRRKLTALLRRATFGRLRLGARGALDDDFRARAAVREPFLTRLGQPGMMNVYGGVPESTAARALRYENLGYNYGMLLQALFTIENFLVRLVKEGHVNLTS